MASSDDLVAYSAAYIEVLKVIPDFDSTNVMSVIAALIWLDRQAGKDSDENIVVISEEHSLWLPMLATFIDPEIVGMLQQPAITDDETADRELMERLDAALAHPFEVIFTDPRHEYVYPVIEGLKRTIRVDDRLRSQDAYTATAPGERIYVGD